jgi:hypothetical protein
MPTVLDVLAAASPIITIGALAAIFTDSCVGILLVQTALAAILCVAAAVSSVIGSNLESD